MSNKNNSNIGSTKSMEGKSVGNETKNNKLIKSKEDKTMNKKSQNNKSMTTPATRESLRVFAKNCMRSEDTMKTRINNNVLVIGNPGCSKTGSYVTPNIYSTTGSIVIADTKGLLYRNHADALRRRGYNVHLLDFVHPENSEPFNILDSVQRKKKTIHRVISPGEWDEDGNVLLEEEVMDIEIESYRQQDLMKIAKLLIPDDVSPRDRFWVDGARLVLTSLMAYALEELPREEQHMGSVADLFRQMNIDMMTTGTVSFFNELEATDPDSYAVKKYKLFCQTFRAEKCWVSMAQFVANALDLFDNEENAKMLCRPGLDLAQIGRERSALFINLSDSDRSQDYIVNAFYTQLFQKLMAEADCNNCGRLKFPVHLILDDFAANVYIPDFDKILSVIRSRDISASIILQSISQLKGMYNEGQASTIINGCDTMLYMGGTDSDTAAFFADKAGKLKETILALDLDHAWLFTRGEKGRIVEKIPPYSISEKDFEAPGTNGLNSIIQNDKI